MSQSKSPHPRGRFAPSPSGPLHLGSLVAALASYLSARSESGEWLIRMEDVDGPRCDSAHADEILRTLESFGLHWDGTVEYQSRRSDHYLAVLDQLTAGGLVYPCTCTRRELAEGPMGVDGPRYPGTCRDAPTVSGHRYALRLRVTDETIGFDDAVFGAYAQHLEQEVGDFVLRRSDGLFAYQLAVVVDDGEQAVTEVVRGADLFSSTPRQIYLQRLLGLQQPSYLHVPVLVDPSGNKLSKQNRAPAISAADASVLLVRCLELLGQLPPSDLASCSRADILAWGVSHWHPANVPRLSQVAIDDPVRA